MNDNNTLIKLIEKYKLLREGSQVVSTSQEGCFENRVSLILIIDVYVQKNGSLNKFGFQLHSYPFNPNLCNSVKFYNSLPPESQKFLVGYNNLWYTSLAFKTSMSDGAKMFSHEPIYSVQDLICGNKTKTRKQISKFNPKDEYNIDFNFFKDGTLKSAQLEWDPDQHPNIHQLFLNEMANMHFKELPYICHDV